MANNVEVNLINEYPYTITPDTSADTISIHVDGNINYLTSDIVINYTVPAARTTFTYTLSDLISTPAGNSSG
jgi:hypothetical protein